MVDDVKIQDFTQNDPGEKALENPESFIGSPSSFYESQVVPPPKLPNHVEEYLKNNVGENAFRDLFEATEDNIDLRTELNENEVDCVNKIFVNNQFLNSKFKDSNIYKSFLINYLRLKVSFNRGSRIEFVDVNKKDRFEQNLKTFGNFSNLSKVKE